MKRKAGSMQQAMDVAAEAADVDNDEVTIAADDAGATAFAQKMGKALQRGGNAGQEECGPPEVAPSHTRPRKTR